MPATCKSCSFLNLSTHNQTFKGNFWFSFLCVFLVLLKSIKTLRSNMITGCHPCGDCLVMPRLSLSLFSLPLSFRRAHAQIPNLQLHRHPQTGRRVESFCSWEKVPLFWHGAPLAHGFSLSGSSRLSAPGSCPAKPKSHVADVEGFQRLIGKLGSNS